MLLDSPNEPLAARVEALRRRTIAIAILMALTACAAALASMPIVSGFWSTVSGGEFHWPALHVPSALQSAASDGLASWIVYGLVAVTLMGFALGRLNRSLAVIFAVLIGAMTIYDLMHSAPLRDPLFFVPSQFERTVLRGDYARAQQLLDASNVDVNSVEGIYTRAQLLVRMRDHSRLDAMTRDLRDRLERYVYGVEGGTQQSEAAHKIYAGLRPEVLLSWDQLLYDRPVGAAALLYTERHRSHDFGGLIRVAIRSVLPLLLLAAAAALLRVWRQMRDVYAEVFGYA
jgi:hypothetical protein